MTFTALMVAAFCSVYILVVIMVLSSKKTRFKTVSKKEYLRPLINALMIIPNIFINENNNKKRIKDIEALADMLRSLVTRLGDLGNLVRALEEQKNARPNHPQSEVINKILEELNLGCSMEVVINMWKDKVNLKKFDQIADTLLQAHNSGWTKEAIKALDKSVYALEEDIQAVRMAMEKAVLRKRKLYLTIALAWSFPIILSLFSVSDKNIFLETIYGQILMVSYVVATVFVLAKGSEYISLNIEEL